MIRPLSKPIKPTGHLIVLKGNLAPTSAVSKITGKEGTSFRGTAICFDTEEDFYPALEAGKVKEGMAVIIRYQVCSRLLLCAAVQAEPTVVCRVRRVVRECQRVSASEDVQGDDVS